MQIISICLLTTVINRQKSRLQSPLKSLFYFILFYVFSDMPINFPHLSIHDDSPSMLTPSFL